MSVQTTPPGTPTALFALLSILCTFFQMAIAEAADRPNIVWILSEDSSKHYFRHFDPDGVETPSIESLAADGVAFNHAFSCPPVCSVARTTLLTGCYGPRIGAQFHRAMGKASIPAGLELSPARLKAAGYYTTNQSKEDYNVVIGQDVWDNSNAKATWKARPEKAMPFFHVQTLKTSHESSLHFKNTEFEKSKVNLDSVKVPASLPDTSLVRFTRFILDFSGKGEVRFRSFDLGTGRWIFAGIRSCVP